MVLRRFTILLCLALTFGLAFGQTDEVQAQSGVPAVIQEWLRAGGVNASGWGFYNCDQYNPNFFNDRFGEVAATGAGHVRLLISMCAIEQGTTGTLRTDRFNDIVAFIRRANSFGLGVIVDNHNIFFKLPGKTDWNEDYMYGLADPAIADRHIRLMSELSRRLGEILPTTGFVVQPANEPIYVWN